MLRFSEFIPGLPVDFGTPNPVQSTSGNSMSGSPQLQSNQEQNERINQNIQNVRINQNIQGVNLGPSPTIPLSDPFLPKRPNPRARELNQNARIQQVQDKAISKSTSYEPVKRLPFVPTVLDLIEESVDE